jgi:hypothetical protein
MRINRRHLALLSGTLLSLPGFAQAIELQDLTLGDPFFYTQDQIITENDPQKALLGTGRPATTHSRIPHLPVYFGYFSTNYTYRFVTVAEQVMTLIGEGKHGLWRVQEAGTVREYLRAGAKGLPDGADPSDPANLEIIRRDYSHYLPEEGWDGYKYPDQKLTADGRLNFVDLPICHAKYDGRYAMHEPVDLANFYCTMSEADYTYAQQAMDFAFSQPGAGEIGPLGRRAGFDIKENYTRAIRLTHMPDARSWVNVGVPGKDETHVAWKPVDTARTKAEYYLLQRPFFNKPYLFVAAVFENEDNADFRYVRPDGAYHEGLLDRGVRNLKNEVTAQPAFHLETGEPGRAIGLPIYGVHHPDRASFGGGGACPLKGGDWGRYPDTRGGSGWPTQYEEVTPICDAVLVDIKFYANLDGRDWADPHKYLANAGTGTQAVTYRMQPGTYGTFSDAYNIQNGRTNAEGRQIPETLTLTFPASEEPVSYEQVPDERKSARMAPAPSTSCRPIAG